MGKAYATKNREHLLKYNALDTVATARAFASMWAEPEWNSPRVRALYEQNVTLSTICAEMHSTGFPVDFPKRTKLAKDLEDLYDDREKKLLDLVGNPNFRCTPNDMRALVYARHSTKKVSRFNLPDPLDPKMWVDDEYKTIAIDQNALLLLLADPSCPKELVEIVDAYWQAEGVWKARSTFVTSDLITKAIGLDGRMRPGWNSLGTDTGRFSCSEPNLMNIPDKKKDDALSGKLPSLRQMYWAGPGCILVHADYSQLELRVMAIVSGDPVLQAALDLGDVYSEDAKEIFGLPAHYTKCECEGECARPLHHVKGSARKSSKTIHLGFQYGAGTPAVHQQRLKQERKATYQSTALIHEGMKKRYARTVAYWAEEHARVRKDGFSRSRIMDRRRVYPREPPPTETANYPIQSTAADIMNDGFIRLWRALRKHVPSARIVAQVHDAVDTICREKDRALVERITQDCLEKEVEIEGKKYVLPVEIKTGTHWSDV